MFAKTVLQSKNLVIWNFHCRHPPSANLHRKAVILTSLPVCVFAYFYPLLVSLWLFLFLSLPPSTYTNTNKHSCHSGLLLRASESPQMGTAKCRCHSASVPKKQGHLLWSQVTTGHLHVHTHAQTYTHKLVSTQTCKVQTHYECKQTYITMPLLRAESDEAVAPTQSGAYF